MSVKQPMDGQYDRGIIPSETAARKEREGEDFKETPEAKGDMDTTAGYTVDQEGLANNYAIEPEMYYEEPGDLRKKEEALEAQRKQELEEVNDTDEEGDLTKKKDDRGKGVGVI
ncbi:hypothetical protein IQ235_02010 [Oscillatoriales cyanobacterium LEGE 11467]|uniref:Uncharacterized protein n=1 Tax=Zarconia navalis LEGE 11467 TaxID=1828826 RepID=A0A928VWK1_9CYAN|nr:hypothetical protein [Zarconia navalis]MBE9039571.1 hypothetical protein [Zarconia navalis LEGE 11467]